MANDIKAKISLDGEASFKQAITEINNNMKYLNSEMVLAKSTTGDLSEKGKQYTNVLEAQRQNVKLMENQLSELRKTHSDNSTEIKLFTTKLNEAKTKMNETENSIKNLGNEEDETSKKTSVFGDVLKANLATEVIKSAVSALANGISNIGTALGNWMDMSQEGVQSEAKLAQVMKNTIDASDEEIQSIIDLADAQEKLGVVSKESTIAGAQELGTYLTKTDNLKALLPVMNDMVAQQYGVNASEEQAVGISTMLGKVMQGQVGALSRYGYSFTEAQEKILKFGTEEERAAVLADVVNESVGGVNKALAETDAAKMIKANETIEDMQKSAGSLLTDIRAGLVAEFLPAIQEVTGALTGMFNGDISIEEGMAKVGSGIMMFVGQIKTMLPQVISTGVEILKSLITGLKTMLPQIMPVIVDGITSLIQAVVEMLPMIIELGVTLLMSLITGIGQMLPELIPTIVQAIITIVDTLVNNIDQIINAGIEILLGLIEGIVNALPMLIDYMPTLISKLVTAIFENLPAIINAGIRLIVALAKGLITAIPQLILQIPIVIAAIWDGLTNVKWGELGSDLIKGIGKGFSDGVKAIGQWIKDTANSIKNKFKELLGIHSPSTVMADEVGYNISAGIAEGMFDGISTINKAVSGINGELVSDIDINPNVKGLTASNSSNVFNVQFGNVSIYNDDDIESIASKLQKYINGVNFSRGVI